MSIWSKIFGSPKTIDRVVEGTVKGLDALVFTEEERSNMKERYSDWYLQYLQATSPQNVARRFIAIVVVVLWALMVLFATLLWKWDSAWSDYIFQVLNDVVNEPFMIIMGFYFLAHAVRAWNDKQSK